MKVATIVLFLMTMAKLAVAFPPCVAQKKYFLSQLVAQQVSERALFPLPPEGRHEVINALPTNQLGQWLELRFARGLLDEVRQVSPSRTLTSSWDRHCRRQDSQILRSFPRGLEGFSDADLHQLMATNQAGVLYTISPAHPLSEVALAGVIDHAKQYHLAITLLTDSTISDEDFKRLQALHPGIKKIESLELIYRGMFDHFPASILYQNGKIIGRPLLGARGEHEIELAFEKILHHPTPQVSLREQTKIHRRPNFGSLDQGTSPYQITQKITFPRALDVKFIRSLPNSREEILIFSTRPTPAVHLFNISSGAIVRSWDKVNSPYASADGKLLLMINEDHQLTFRGLHHGEPFFVDHEISNAWYPAVSVLPSKNGRSHYRVITRMMDLKVQDYSIDFASGDVRPLGPEHRICTNMATNATPFISRFGGTTLTLIQDNNDRQIVKLNADDTCTPLVNLGFWTWKATFSYDDQKISFTGVSLDSRYAGEISSFKQLLVSEAFIYDRQHRQLSILPDSAISRFSFPEFMADGKVLLWHKDGDATYSGAVYQR